MKLDDILEENKDTCMYCGSTAYGPGCPHAPNRIHVHPHNSGKCIYCGSTARGQGCPHNPLGRVHVHGVDFNLMIKEALKDGLTLGYLMKRLTQPITEWNAYKAGLIDENGKTIKVPESVNEKSLLTKADKYVLRLKSLMDSHKLDLLNNSIYLSDSSSPTLVKGSLYSESYKKEMQYKEKINDQIKSLFETIGEANLNGISTNKIESLIVESISNL